MLAAPCKKAVANTSDCCLRLMYLSLVESADNHLCVRKFVTQGLPSDKKLPVPIVNAQTKQQETGV